MKGIDPRARARAKTAARRQGMTLGEWLNRVILEESDPSNAPWDDALSAFPGFSPGSAPASPDEDRLLRSMINKLGERLDSSEDMSTKALTNLDKALNQIAEKVAQGESRQTSVLSDARKHLDGMRKGQEELSKRIGSLEKSSASSGVSGETIKALETTLLKLARRLYETEHDLSTRVEDSDAQIRETSDTLRRTSESLETRIERMEGRAEDFSDLSKRRDQRTAEAVSGLRKATESLRQRVDNAERSASDASHAFDRITDKLDDRLRHLETRNSGDNVELERRFDRLSDDLAKAITDTRSQMATALSNVGGDARVDRLESSLAQALQRMDSAERRQSEGLHKLGEEITRLAGAIDRRMSESERRTSDASRDARAEQQLERRLDAVRDENRTSIRRMGEEVTRLGQSLADRIARAEERSSEAVQSATDRMAQVIEKLDAAQGAREADLEERLKGTEERTAKRIEDALGGVEDRIATLRSENVEAMTPVQRALSALADRLEKIEKKPEEDEKKAKAKSSDKEDEAIDFDTPLAPPPQAEVPTGAVTTEESDPFIAMQSAPAPAPVMRAPAPQPVVQPVLQPAPQPVPQPAPQMQPQPVRPAARRMGATADADFLAAARQRTRQGQVPHPAAAPRQQSRESQGGGRSWLGIFAFGGAVIALIAAGGLLVMSMLNQDGMPGDNDADSADLVASLEADLAGNSASGTAPAQPDTTAMVAEEAPGDSAGAPERPNDRPAEEARTQTPVQTAAVEPDQTATARSTPDRRTEADPLPPANVVADASASIVPPQVDTSASTAAPAASFNARTTLEDAAAGGDPVARYLFGMQRLEAGDTDGALILLRRAAEQGIPAAQYRYSKMLERGEGIEPDLDEARRWTERAANAGHRRAMHNLGIMNYYGTGTAQDYETAARWFQEAALMGLKDSQFNLGLLYEEGRGVPLSPPDAYAWLMIAASDNDPTAAQRAAALTELIPPDALAEAEAAIASFQPRPIDPEANGIYRDRPWDRTVTADSASVHRAQGFLSVLGYRPGPIDGEMGEQTRQAIMRFEADNGLPQTGRVDSVLLERLQRATES